MHRSGNQSVGRFLRSNGTQLVILRGNTLSLFDLVEGKMELVVNSDLFATGRNIATIHFSGIEPVFLIKDRLLEGFPCHYIR